MRPSAAAQAARRENSRLIPAEQAGILRVEKVLRRFCEDCKPSLSGLQAGLTAVPPCTVCFRQSRKRPARPAKPADTNPVRGPAVPPTPPKAPLTVCDPRRTGGNFMILWGIPVFGYAKIFDFVRIGDNHDRLQQASSGENVRMRMFMHCCNMCKQGLGIGQGIHRVLHSGGSCGCHLWIICG